MKNAEQLAQILFGKLNEKDYGTYIPYSEIEKELNLTRDLLLFARVIKLTRKKLQVEGKVLKTINNKGYQILKPQHVSGFVYRNNIQKGIKCFDSGKFIMEHLHTDLLSEERMKEFQEMSELLKNIQTNSKQVVSRSEYFKNKDKYNNIND